MVMVEHGPDCSCVRCAGFKPGNDAALRHGAYASSLRLGERTAELRDEIRAVVPGYHPADEIAVGLLALTLARAEAAATTLVTAEAGKHAELERVLRAWIAKATTLVNALGMTPTSRARLRLDVALGSRASTQLKTHIAETYGGDAEVVNDVE